MPICTYAVQTSLLLIFRQRQLLGQPGWDNIIATYQYSMIFKMSCKINRKIRINLKRALLKRRLQHKGALQEQKGSPNIRDEKLWKQSSSSLCSESVPSMFRGRHSSRQRRCVLQRCKQSQTGHQMRKFSKSFSLSSFLLWLP